MGKIIAIDYGLKRSGIAATDDLQMIAFGVTAIKTPLLISYLKNYCKENTIDKIVIGLSTNLQGKLNDIEKNITTFISLCNKELPTLPIERQDERFTSKIAQQSILTMGKKKKDRQNKFLIDEISATLILQSYLEKLH